MITTPTSERLFSDTKSFTSTESFTMRKNLQSVGARNINKISRIKQYSDVVDMLSLCVRAFLKMENRNPKWLQCCVSIRKNLFPFNLPKMAPIRCFKVSHRWIDVVRIVPPMMLYFSEKSRPQYGSTSIH